MKAKDTEGPFSKRLQELMQDHDPPLDIMGLADETGLFVYEHARKLVRGKTLPSESMTRELARFFGIDPEELSATVREDRFLREYGENSPTPVFNKEVAPFVHAWPLLTEQQRATLTHQLKSFVTANAKALEKGKAKGSAR